MKMKPGPKPKKRKYTKKLPIKGLEAIAAANVKATLSRAAKDEANKEQDEYKKWVEMKFYEVLKYFLIDFVTLEFNYADQPPLNGNKGNVVFTVGASNSYHQLAINIYPSSHQMFRQGKKKQLVDGIVHELAHYHTNPLAQEARNRFATQETLRDSTEHVTEVMAQYIRLYLRSKPGVDIYKK